MQHQSEEAWFRREALSVGALDDGGGHVPSLDSPRARSRPSFGRDGPGVNECDREGLELRDPSCLHDVVAAQLAGRRLQVFDALAEGRQEVVDVLHEGRQGVLLHLVLRADGLANGARQGAGRPHDVPRIFAAALPLHVDGSRGRGADDLDLPVLV